MFPILYTSITEGTVPSHLGAGTLTDCLSATVKEARNGEYELTMEYAAYGIHADEIAPNTFIMAKPNFTDDPQIFRVYKVGKTLNGRFTVNAQHISYDLSGRVITSGTASSAAGAITLLRTCSGFFSIYTDKTVSAPFKITEPSSVRSWFGGKAGSILDVYGPGEWKYDNFKMWFKAARGTDRGVTIRYGKNLTELSQVLDMTNLVSEVFPYYKDADGNITNGSPVSTSLVDFQRDLAVDFSASVDPESATPIATQLATLATAYVANNNFTTIKNSITLDFVQLKEIAERVDLCDTVHIYFEPLGITATAKCIETVWDVLEERYISTSFGDARTNIADTIANTQKQIEDKPSTSQMQAAVTHATEKITGNLGGYVVIHDSNNDGQPDEILIMDDPDISQAVKVWRWNKSGLGYSSTGYAGPYGLAMTDDGEIVADFITTGTLNANLIKAGVISDVQGNSTIDMTNGSAKMKDFNAINSLTLIDSNNVVRAAIKYTSLDGGAFELYDYYGARIASLQNHPIQGTFLVLKEPGGVEGVRTAAGGTGGGWLETKNYDDKRTFLVDGTANGNGTVQIWDANGNHEASLNIFNSSGVSNVEIKKTSTGGCINLGNDSSYVFGSFYCASGGGVLELANQNYINIECKGSNGKITCVSLTQTSSRKVKENIQPMEDYRKILDLDAVSFDFKEKEYGTDKRGFIAEDVEKVLPNLVTPESEKMSASLDYLGMIPYLQAMIKDQEKRIQALEEKLKKK